MTYCSAGYKIQFLPQRKHNAFNTNANCLMLLEEIIGVRCDIHTKKNTLYIQNGRLVGDKTGGTYSYHSATKDQNTACQLCNNIVHILVRF